jgi:multiple sugar transport system permease protein/cellobiose transport system permease protein
MKVTAERRFNLVVTGGLLLVSIVYVAPLYLAAVFATHSVEALYRFPPPLWFGDQLLANLDRMAVTFPPLQPVYNSLAVALPKTIGLVLVSAFAGYGFARYARAPGRRLLLGVTISTIFLPPALSLIPFYLQMAAFGWLNSYWPLIVPTLASGFGVIWMYTYIGGAVPRELYEAAEMDGARGIATFVLVVLPIIRPGLAALGVWTLIGTWNDFQLPLVVLTDANLFTVPLALTQLSGLYASDTPAVMLATVIGTLPVFVLFALLSRQFISGLTGGAVK